jgi:hypothetical protein
MTIDTNTALGRFGLSLAAASLLLTPMAALAKGAGDLRDLVGARAAGGETQMEERGWVSTSAHKGAASSYVYWWNGRDKSCVRVATRDGRYDQITDTSATDCGQKSGGGDKAAAIAGAAALLGVIALASKSHHRNDQDYNSSNDYADFERGHRDGLYNHPYSNSGNNQRYADGYQSGVDERGHQSSYRPEYRNYQGNGWSGNNGANNGGGGGGWSGGGGQQAGFNDLVGSRAAGAQSELGRRGFRMVDTFQSGSNGSGTIWWNGGSRQCLQMITADGRADSINDIQTHPRCR